MYNFFSSVLFWLDSWSIADVQALTSILQNLTLTVATFVAAWWAYSTFGLKEKTDELLSIARKIVEIHSHIDGSSSTFDLHQTLVGLGSFDRQKLVEIKYSAEARLDALKEELRELQELSLRIPVAFRILNITEYQLVLIDLSLKGGIDHWGDAEVKERLTQAKFKILNEIYTEMNRPGNFLKKFETKVKNMIYRIKGLSSQ